jgi:hypothetical protein
MLTPRGLFGFGPSSIGVLLALLVFVAFPSSSALAIPKCATPQLDGGTAFPFDAYVHLFTTTAGATIFYRFSEYAPPSAPTHSGSTATGGTLTYTGVTFIIPVGEYGYWKAVAYKPGYADSNIADLSIDNTGN